MKNLILTANIEDLVAVLIIIGAVFWMWSLVSLWWVGRRLERRTAHLLKTILENT